MCLEKNTKTWRLWRLGNMILFLLFSPCYSFSCWFSLWIFIDKLRSLCKRIEVCCFFFYSVLLKLFLSGQEEGKSYRECMNSENSELTAVRDLCRIQPNSSMDTWGAHPGLSAFCWHRNFLNFVWCQASHPAMTTLSFHMTQCFFPNQLIHYSAPKSDTQQEMCFRRNSVYCDKVLFVHYWEIS